MLNFFYRLYNGYELVAILISGLGVLISGIAAIKKKKESRNGGIYLILTVLIIILIFSLISGAIRSFYTEAPDIIGYTLLDARHRLHRDHQLVLDDAAEQLFNDNLGNSNFVVQAQEPKGGEIVLKNSVVTVIIKDTTDSHDVIDEPPIQNPDDTDTSSISTPTQDTIKPTTPIPSTSKPTPNSNSTPNNSTSTESGTDTGDYQPAEPPISDYHTNNPYSDPAFNGNASVGGGVNSDVGPGEYQPEVPSTPTPSTSKPTPNSNSTPNNSTGTESGTDTGDYQPAEPPISDYNTNNPYSDPAFNGNASVGGGVNSDIGPGEYQPEVP